MSMIVTVTVHVIEQDVATVAVATTTTTASHFCDSKHPLVFEQDNRYGDTCYGCQETVYGPSYNWESRLISRRIRYCFHIHKSCAELPLGLHHPLHLIHPLILHKEDTYSNEDKEFRKCELCKESHRREYTYQCYHCDFNLHARCASLLPTIESEVHHHPLTPLWKWMTYTCDLCGKKVKGIPNHCALCSYCIYNTCASLPHKLKVKYHMHPLHLAHSSLEVELHQSDFQFCKRYAQKVNTNFGFYYCSRCDFIAHVDCAVHYRYRENINLQELKETENEDSELDQSIDLATYKSKILKRGRTKLK